MADVMFEAKHPVARKTHECDQCGRGITAGETYRRDAGIYDGAPYAMVCCLQCEAFGRELYDLGIEGEAGWPHLPDVDWRDLEWTDRYETDDTVRLLRAFVLFRRRWCTPTGALYAYPKSSSSGSES